MSENLKKCRCGEEITKAFIKPPLMKVPRGYLGGQAKYMTETECIVENCNAKIRLYLKPKNNSYEIIRREIVEVTAERIDHKGRVEELELTPEKVKDMKKQELIDTLQKLNIPFQATGSNAVKVQLILDYMETGLGSRTDEANKEEDTTEEDTKIEQ